VPLSSLGFHEITTLTDSFVEFLGKLAIITCVLFWQYQNVVEMFFFG